MKERKQETKSEITIGAKTDAINSIESRFALEGRIIADIERTKLRIAHPGWVQLAAAHPTPELPKLEKGKPMLPEIKPYDGQVKKIGLSLSLPEIGERKKKK